MDMANRSTRGFQFPSGSRIVPGGTQARSQPLSPNQMEERSRKSSVMKNDQMRGKSGEGQTQYGMCYEGMEAFVRRACTSYYAVRRWGQQWGSIIISFLDVGSDNVCQEIYMRTSRFHLSNPQGSCPGSTAAAASTVHYKKSSLIASCQVCSTSIWSRRIMNPRSSSWTLKMEKLSLMRISQAARCPPSTLLQSPKWLLGLGRLSIIFSVVWMMSVAECSLRKQIRNCLHRQR